MILPVINYNIIIRVMWFCTIF